MKASSITSPRHSHVSSDSVLQTIRRYYALTKPGIIYGNALTTVAGFLFALGQSPAVKQNLFTHLLMGVVGTSLVIAGACIINNVIDRHIDRAMERTKKRGLVTGAINVRPALVCATVFVITGFALLVAYVNVLTALVGLVGLVDYVVLYGLAKRHGPYGTLVGSISGATPVMAGYTAATGQLDMTAWWLFAIMAAWQMPHFYAIAIYRAKDYAAARIPVLPLVRGVQRTRRSMVVYMLVYAGLVAGLALYIHAGMLYVALAVGSAAWWLSSGQVSWKTAKPEAWARQTFFRSLIVLLALSLGLALDGLL